MKYLNKLIILMLVSFIANIYSQQDPQYTNYMYNTMSVNPAFAGSRGHLSMVFMARSQWVGVEGAPETQTLSFDTPLNVKGLAVGVNAINDNVGPVNEIFIDGNVSYFVNLTEKQRLTFGLKLGSRTLSIDSNEFITKDSGDAKLNGVTSTFATIGAGLLYSTEKFYAAISVPNFMLEQDFDSTNQIVAKERLHFFGMLGYSFDLDTNLKFKPSVFFKSVNGAPVSLDLSTNFLFNDKFNAGLAWRWGDSIATLLGYHLSQKVYLGYSYDLTTSDFQVDNTGTHEIVFRFSFKNKEKTNDVRLSSVKFF